MESKNRKREKKMAKATANGSHGAKWIRREKRLAIYIRDGLCCCYCGASVEDGTALTLDHIKPRGKGGSHDQTNLVTSCLRCNSARGDRPLATFARAVAEYCNDRTADQIVKTVNRLRRRVLDVPAAKALISKRGSYAAALNK